MDNPNIVLVDADTIPYRVGFTTEDVSRTDIVAARIDTFIEENIFQPLDDQSGRSFVFLLGSQDKSNFRFTIFPEYKANRSGRPKPRHFEFIREYLIEGYDAEVISGWEVDDEVAYRSTLDPYAVICSIDKDLDQLEGQHFNYHPNKLLDYYIDYDQGMNWFYRQLLIGDKTDNIEGIYGIGPKKAEKILEGLSTEIEHYEKCLQTYLDNNRTEEEMILNARLLWLMREPIKDDLSNLWQKPKE